jgi:phenylpropionate dioxygenase-like ring-hydroxylating dioxygenase large terminal subunit
MLKGNEAETDSAVHASGMPVLPHQNWYAVALSSEVTADAPVGVPFAGGRLALYRSGGKPVALSARCAHMGADLAAGDIVDGTLRCMFHHFCYDADGRCVSIPSSDRIPRRARVHSFAVRDHLGLVWVFNGEAPTSGPPGIPGYDVEGLAVRARRTDLFEVDPWVIIANSFDFMHLRYVHNLMFDFDETSIDWSDRGAAYAMTFTMPDGLVANQNILVTGTNTVSYVTGGDIDSMGMFTSTPIGNGSQSYYVAATPTGGDTDARLQLQEHIADELLKDDTRALAGMRFRQGAFVGEDRSLARYLGYVRSFPVFDPTMLLD